MLRFFLFLFFVMGLIVPQASFAQSLESQILNQVDMGAVNAQLKADYNQDSIDPRQVIATTIQVILSLLGTVFLVLVASGGYIYLTAGGDESRVTKAKSTITNGVIGLVIVLGAYSITLFVIRGFDTAVSDGQPVNRSDVQQNPDLLNERLNQGNFFR
ncbi:MAG: hypothetical protein COU30_04270 [Candidatus Magasanikbacteria bacterium CG10_big_fil_rev_8_21_14_0_10_38_6]|uniref:Uncharacterized protein n=1 Tax=Candidatus Magasanikbacteria bacterium CG10_big_fil_rev_8_21_14_0_10_38_6 TaxID=1974647 RepID=A0A2M6P052_9BACT|nr:MAG: hypothetical protein COU30_04270 [Candidatus Magasanikbacteria bacterium CG10_big_fil_rev_8_21_14_0_10_38_6]